MKSFGVVLLAGVLALLGCGCAGSPSTPAGEALESGEPADRAGFRLEREGFAVLEFRARVDEYDRVYVVGEVKNVGAAASGVELQATLRDADGHIVAVGHFYPASHTNIDPGQSWPFAYSFGKQEQAAEAELRIVGAFRTMDLTSVAYLSE